MKAAFTHTPNPKPWKIGRIATIASFSPRPHHAAACIPCAMKLRFDSTMPFGRPVVPPEKSIAAGSPVFARSARCLAARSCEERSPRAHARVFGHPRNLAPLRCPEPQALERREVFGDSRDDDACERFLWRGRCERAIEGVERERHSCAGDIEEMRDLGRGGKRMDQGRQRAHAVRGIERDHALRRGRHRDEEAVPVAQPLRRERGRASIDLGQQLRVGGPGAEEVPGDRRRHAARRGGERFVERDLGVGKGRRNLAVEAKPGADFVHWPSYRGPFRVPRFERHRSAVNAVCPSATPGPGHEAINERPLPRKLGGCANRPIDGRELPLAPCRMIGHFASILLPSSVRTTDFIFCRERRSKPPPASPSSAANHKSIALAAKVLDFSFSPNLPSCVTPTAHRPYCPSCRNNGARRARSCHFVTSCAIRSGIRFPTGRRSRQKTGPAAVAGRTVRRDRTCPRSRGENLVRWCRKGLKPSYTGLIGPGCSPARVTAQSGQGKRKSEWRIRLVF